MNAKKRENKKQMVKLNLVVIRTENIEPLIQWHSQTFDLAFVAEKHEDGVLHYSAQVDDGLIEIYPTKQNAARITFGVTLNKDNFEKKFQSKNLKIIAENTFLVKDIDGNSIILSLCN